MELDRGDYTPDLATPIVTWAELPDSPPLHILYVAAISTYPHFAPTSLGLHRVSN